MKTQQRRHPLKRPGCVFGLILWFVVLLTPCFMIILAVQGEISIQTGSVPEQRVRIWLIQEANQSGVGISTPKTFAQNEAMCIQTNVTFMLWRGSSDPTQYCECYTQSGADWQIISTNPGICAGE